MHFREKKIHFGLKQFVQKKSGKRDIVIYYKSL